MSQSPQTRAHLTLLAGVAGIVLVLISGLGLAIHFAVSDANPATATAPTTSAADASVESVRDEIASAPMLPVGAEAATGGIPATGEVPSITIPRGYLNGAEGVPTGYPRTPEGAVGQLGQILWSVLSPMDLAHASQVEAAWFETHDDTQTWPVIRLMREFLHAGQLTTGLPPGASLQVVPVAGQIKGSDGDSWHVACVLLDMTYTYRDQARMAYGHCERMTWIEGRWVIASGLHPVPAPSTWPGTELAVEAGWRTWIED